MEQEFQAFTDRAMSIVIASILTSSIDRSVKDYVTITPALLKGDRLLRRVE